MYISIWIGWIWWMHQMQYFGFTQRTMWWDWKWGSSWTDSNRLEINRNHFHLSLYSQLKSVLSEWSNELFIMNMNFPLLFKYILCFKMFMELMIQDLCHGLQLFDHFFLVCVFPMFVIIIPPHTGNGWNNHQESAPHLTW